MRRLLPLAVVLGVLAWVAAPALSVEPYTPKVAEFEMAPAAGVHARAAGGPVVLPVMRAPKRFDLVGLKWKDTRAVEARIRVRREGGRWSAWLDPGEAESGERGTPPVLTGGTDEVQVRLNRLPRGLKLHFVNATGTADRGARLLTKVRHAVNTAVITAFGAPAIAAKRQASGAPPMVTRDQWDPAGQCKPRNAPDVGQVQAAVVHHTVTSNLYTAQDGPSMVLAICRYHRNSNGWSDIGYNFLVDRYGTIYEGRQGGIDKAVVGAQAQGFNATTTGISNLGTYMTEGVPEVALQANARVIAWKLGISGVPLTGTATIRSGGGSQSKYPAGRMVTVPVVSGHRDVGNTDCPGNALYDQLPHLRDLVANGTAGIPTGPQPTTPVPSGAITIAAPNATVAYGAGAQVGGRVTRNDGSGYSGAQIKVQVRTAARWQTVTTTTAGDDGGWLATMPSTRTRQVRALAYVNGQRAATSSPLKIAVQAVVTAKAARRVVYGRPLTITGKVRPAKGRLVLEIARQGRDQKYHIVARVRIKPKRGAFRVVTRLRRPALHRLRIRFAGDKTNAAATSADVVLRAIRPKASRGGAAARA